MDIPIGYCYCGCGRKTKINRKARLEYGYLKGQPSRFVSGHDKRKYPQTCSIPGCRRRHRARGYCSMHYKRLSNGNNNLSPEPLLKRHEGPCKIPGCEKKAFVHGYCKMHHGRIRYGSQNLSPEMLIKKFYQTGLTDEQKFLARITKSENGCWIWAGPFQETGRHHEFIYGRFPVKQQNGKWKSALAHIFSYTHFKGAIPEGHEIHHKCDNQICVNPEHLELVTKTGHMMKSNWLSSTNARKTQCPKGHDPSEYVRVSTTGHRYCRICRRERKQYYHQYYINVRKPRQQQHRKEMHQ